MCDTVVKNCCPYSVFKEEEGIVTSCDGTVIWKCHEFVGTCQLCGADVPLIQEM